MQFPDLTSPHTNLMPKRLTRVVCHHARALGEPPTGSIFVSAILPHERKSENPLSFFVRQSQFLRLRTTARLPWKVARRMSLLKSRMSGGRQLQGARTLPYNRC